MSLIVHPLIIKKDHTYVIEVPGTLSKEGVENLRSEWERATGANAVVVHGGMKITRRTHIGEVSLWAATIVNVVIAILRWIF